ncbi:AAA family ATPase [Amycolatopsis sp. CA-128772]|uniref:AAA family ATPase n=1 Tax=Amycolatopsis sp. CA-128772 TaxID=2073159 RepID=UPI000CD2DC16|nr:LuxR family transcriptional regulator [Amycolatopsis sp. CA-128772]
MAEVTSVAGRVAGRRRELEVLGSAFANARAGSATLVRVRGATGTGKTALLAEFARSVGDRAVVLSETCRRPGGAGRAAEGLLPDSGGRDGMPVPVLSRRLGRRLAELTVAGPVVVLLDDFHHCDEASVRVLAHQAHRGAEQPLLVVVAQRPAGHPLWPPMTLPPGDVATIDLGAFTEAEVAGVAAAWWPEPPGPGFVAELTELTGGNPALLGDVCAALHLDGLAADEHALARARVLVPAARARLVERALAGRPVHVRRAAEAVAVLGAPDVELVALLGGVPEPLAAEALGVLAAERLLRADGRELVSPAVRDAVLAGVPERRLESLRLSAARLLNDRGCAPEDVGAHLLGRRRLPERWMRDVLAEAARTAERAGRPHDAARYLGVLVADRPQDVPMRIEFARLVGVRDPLAAYATLAGVAELAEDPRSRARISLQLAIAALPAREPQEATRLLTGALEQLGGHAGDADRGLRIELEAALLAVAFEQPGALDLLGARLPAMSTLTGQTPAEVGVLAMAAVAHMVRGTDRDLAVSCARRALERPEPSVRWAGSLAAYVLFTADEVDEALHALGGLAPGPVRGDAGWPEVVALTAHSWLTCGAGDLSRALSDASAAVRAAEHDDRAELATAPLVAQALVLLQQGDVDGAAAAMARADRTGPDGSLLRFPMHLLARGRLAEARGDLAEAVAAFRRCGAGLRAEGSANPVFVPWWLDGARVLVRLGRRSEAAELVAHGEELARAWGSASARGLALLGRGLVADGDAAVDGLTAATAVLGATPASWYLAEAETALGRARLRTGDHQGARRAFRAAVDLSVRSGFWSRAEDAQAGVTAAGGRNYPVTGSVTDVLTLGERRVGELAAAGATNRIIADTLQLAVRTVEIHLTSVYRKLGVSGRTQLQDRFPAGLLAPEPVL